MIDLEAMLRIVSSMRLDPDTREALLRAARGESDQEIEAAIETLAQALGILDAHGELNAGGVRDLMKGAESEPEDETEAGTS